MLIFNLKNTNKDKLSFSCLLIDECIDIIDKREDTLFILLQDNRIFYKDDYTTVVISKGYKINRHILKTSIQINYNYNFIILKTFDMICLFKKQKNRRNTYKIFSIKEVMDYKDKNFIDIKNSDIHIRG
jgi:hypothetical protein